MLHTLHIRDLALIEGYVHARDGFYQEALEDFTRAVERDPKMATGYANRGFMRNNLRQAKQAVQDFQRAIKIRPDYGEAHFGLAYSYLQLHHPQPALDGVLYGGGVEAPLPIPLNANEEAGLRHSAETIREAIKHVGF